MDYESCKVSVPGKLMVLGEHAVLHGRWSIVCAINRRVLITLKRRDDRKIILQSALGQFTEYIDSIHPRPPFQFVLTAIKENIDCVDSGFNLTIDTELSDQIGLGTSAAVTVATIAVLYVSKHDTIDRESIFEKSLSVVRNVQGLGSGADVAASVHGGLIAYRNDPMEIEKISSGYPITVLYSGKKSRTTQIARHVLRLQEEFPELYEHLFDLINLSCIEAITAVRSFKWRRFGQIMDFNQGLMEAMGVSNSMLSSMVYALRKDQGIVGAKISGSGLGDCIIGLGAMANPNFPYNTVPVQIDPEGIRIERGQ